MNWHTEHHMYAGVPCYNLKALAKELAPNMPEPRTLLAAWKEMRETWQKQKQDPDYAFDTPAPATIRGFETPADDDIVNSIGELAPKGSSIN